MKRKLLNRNKRKYSSLIKLATIEDLRFDNLLQILASVQELKQHRRISKRYGTLEDWDNFEVSSRVITVPIVSRKDNRILSYGAYFSVEMLPVEKKEQFASFFAVSDSAKGVVSSYVVDEFVSDEESRDSAISDQGEL